MVDLDLRSRRDGSYSSLSQQRSKILQRYYSRTIQWWSATTGRNGSTMVQFWQCYQNLRLFVNWSWKRTHSLVCHYPAKVGYASLTRYLIRTHVATVHTLELDAVWLYDQLAQIIECKDVKSASSNSTSPVKVNYTDGYSIYLETTGTVLNGRKSGLYICSSV